MAYRQFVETLQRLRDYGIVSERSKVFAMHIGDNGGLTHLEAQEMGEAQGFIVGYDGMVLDLD